MDVSSILGGSAQSPTSSTQSSSNLQLNTNSFMQLFLAELQNQDPTQTMSTSDMLNQFTQINTIEALTTLSQTEQNTENTVQAMFAHQLLGSTVTVQDSGGNKVTGKVSSIGFSNGSPNLVVNNQSYPLSNLLSMS